MDSETTHLYIRNETFNKQDVFNNQLNDTAINSVWVKSGNAGNIANKI